MASLANAKVEVEINAVPVAMEKLTDTGDHQKFSTNVTYISERSDVKPNVLPNGFITGDNVIPGVSGTNNKVDVPASTCNLNGVANQSIAASLDLTITRAATNVASITSITVNSAGSVVAIKGTDSADATFDLTGRGGAGQPPYIPIDSIERAQVRTTSNVAAKITKAEIFQVRNSEREDAAYPPFEINNFDAQIEFKTALPAIHTGNTTKAVHAEVADVVFIEQDNADAFVPAKKTSSVSTTQVYNGSIAAESRAFSNASFTVIMNNGIDTDAITFAEDEITMVRYYPDRDKTQYSLTQGRLNYTMANAASGNPTASVTVAALAATKEYSV